MAIHILYNPKFILLTYQKKFILLLLLLFELPLMEIRLGNCDFKAFRKHEINNVDYIYKPDQMFNEINDLKIKFEHVFNNLKYRYPIHFEYPITSNNSGYISKYTDSSDENENSVGNSDYDVVYQSLQQEHNRLFPPQTEIRTS